MSSRGKDWAQTANVIHLPTDAGYTFEHLHIEVSADVRKLYVHGRLPDDGRTGNIKHFFEEPFIVPTSLEHNKFRIVESVGPYYSWYLALDGYKLQIVRMFVLKDDPRVRMVGAII